MRRMQARNHLHALLRPATLNHQVAATAQSQGWQLAGPFGCPGHNWHGPPEAHKVARCPAAWLICLTPLPTTLHLWTQRIAPAASQVFRERTGGEVRDERGGWMEEHWRMDCGKHLFTTALLQGVRPVFSGRKQSLIIKWHFVHSDFKIDLTTETSFFVCLFSIY